METAKSVFDERRAELEEYLNLQEQRETSVRGHARDDALSTNVNRSACLLMIYTLLEASITECLEAVKRSVIEGQYRIEQLVPALGGSITRARVQNIPQTQDPLIMFDVYNRFSALFGMPALPADSARGVVLHKSGGNYNLKQILKACRTVGIELRSTMSEEEWTELNKQEHSLNQLVEKRNRLAHGTVTLAEEGATLSLPDLKRHLAAVDTVIQAIISAFVRHIDQRSFLLPDDSP